MHSWCQPDWFIKTVYIPIDTQNDEIHRQDKSLVIETYFRPWPGSVLFYGLLICLTPTNRAHRQRA